MFVYTIVALAVLSGKESHRQIGMAGEIEAGSLDNLTVRILATEWQEVWFGEVGNQAELNTEIKYNTHGLTSFLAWGLFMISENENYR